MLENDCDNVLFALKSEPPRHYLAWDYDSLKRSLPDVNIDDTLAILRIENLIVEDIGSITISDLGRILLLKGGFLAKSHYESELEKIKSRQSQMEQNHKKVNTRINRLIALWTGIAAIYYALEVLNHWLPIYPSCR